MSHKTLSKRRASLKGSVWLPVLIAALGLGVVGFAATGVMRRSRAPENVAASRKEYVNRRLLTPRLASDLNALGDEAQSLDSSKRNSDLATRLIKNVALEGQLWHLLTRLSLNYDIPIGVEISSDEQLSNNYRVELSEGTIADLMGQIIKQNEQYDWLIENGVVNIFPRDKYRNAFLAELLKVRIGSFAVTQNSDCWKFEDDLVNTPEVKAVIEAHGMQTGANFSGFYIPQLGRQFSLKVSDTTLKSLLNRVIRESPLVRIWLISTDTTSRTLSLKVSSRQQER